MYSRRVRSSSFKAGIVGVGGFDTGLRAVSLVRSLSLTRKPSITSPPRSPTTVNRGNSEDEQHHIISISKEADSTTKSLDRSDHNLLSRASQNSDDSLHEELSTHPEFLTRPSNATGQQEIEREISVDDIFSSNKLAPSPVKEIVQKEDAIEVKGEIQTTKASGLVEEAQNNIDSEDEATSHNKTSSSPNPPPIDGCCNIM